MKRASLLCALASASAFVSACDIPTVTFSDTTSGNGGSTTTESKGGSGGTTTSAGGGNGGDSTTTTTTSGSGGAGGMGGIGGMGGMAGMTGSGGQTTTTTTTGTGGGPTGPELQCNYPNVSYCQPGEVCCLDKTSPYQDKCGQPGKCTPQSDWGEASCAKNSHCDPGMICCLYYVPNGSGGYDVQGSYCDVECTSDNDELAACDSDADCGGVPFTCQKMLGSAYPEYKFCLL